MQGCCFARWRETSGFYLRDQTILQFGRSWDLIANILLLNPGSAEPRDEKCYSDFLFSKNLPYFLNEGDYYEFALDSLMRYLINLFSAYYGGGVLKIYNLFNLKEADSKKALVTYRDILTKNDYDIQFIHTFEKKILLCGRPLLLAHGNSFVNFGKHVRKRLTQEQIKYIEIAKKEKAKLFALKKTGKNSFAFRLVKSNRNNYIESYHPSYTLRYGNITNLGNLKEQNG